MIAKIFRKLWTITYRQRIRTIPARWLSTEFRSASRDEWRVMARLGARSPHGVRAQVKRRRLADADEYARQLEHFRPIRALKRRISRMAGRALNAHDYIPHRAELKRRRRSLRPEVVNLRIEEVKAIWKRQ